MAVPLYFTDLGTSITSVVYMYPLKMAIFKSSNLCKIGSIIVRQLDKVSLQPPGPSAPMIFTSFGTYWTLLGTFPEEHLHANNGTAIVLMVPPPPVANLTRYHR